MKIWQRYLLGHLIRTFSFFLICILIFYIAIDFSMNGVRFLSKETTSWLDITANYFRHFSKFTSLFFSLSLLLAMLRVLLDLSAHREIIALQMAGLPLKKLLAPFFFFAAILAAVMLINFQWISPDAQQSADHFYKAHSSHSYLKSKVFSLILQDGSELVYQKFDPIENELFDVFWICSFDKIWHIKRLAVDSSPPAARGADLFIREKNGSLEKSDSHEQRFFPEISWQQGAILQNYVPFENRSLTTLWQQSRGNSSDKQKSAAHLHYKLAQPVILFLMIFLAAPFAIRHSRTRQSLGLIALSLFSFVGLMTLLDAMLILAENQVVPPKYAIWAPLVVLLGIFQCAKSSV
ncbi:MAG TPA: LptF/LptG family permease [Chlamydiales bacterium]|nr:LptF/LptG family permease [Chlamydiales bacterium]